MNHSISYAKFLDIYQDQIQLGCDLRMGQLFHILFIKDEDSNPLTQDMFEADGVDAIQMISDWMNQIQMQYCDMIIPKKNYKKLPKILKALVNEVL